MPRKEPVSGSHFPSLFSLPLPPHSLGRAPSLNPNPFCKQSLKPTTSEVFVLFIKLLAFPGTSLFLHREFSSFDFFSPSAQSCFSANLPDICTQLSYQSLTFGTCEIINYHLSSQTSCLSYVLVFFSERRHCMVTSSETSDSSFVSSAHLLCLPHPVATASVAFYFCISQNGLMTPLSQRSEMERLVSPSRGPSAASG